MGRLWLAICLAAAIWMLGEPALAAKRLALVIGNDTYSNLPVLRKAVNDARAVKEVLTSIGFDVIPGEDLTRRQMNRKLVDLEARIAPGDEVLFFFAGHGVSLGGENYLIPTDMPRPERAEESLVRGESFAVNDIVRRMRTRGASATFLILDACRNNPFEASGVRSIGTSRGLSRIDAPSGVFVLFSAGLGQRALDRLSDGDADPNSVFTRKLVPLLKTPGLNHVSLAKRIQQDVSRLASTVSHRQQPAYYDQIIGEIVLNRSGKQPAETPAPAPAPSPGGDPAAAAWAAVKDTTSVAILKAFADQFPGSVYAIFARARIKELTSGTVATLDESQTPATDERSSVDDDAQVSCRYRNTRLRREVVVTTSGAECRTLDGSVLYSLTRP